MQSPIESRRVWIKGVEFHVALYPDAETSPLEYGEGPDCPYTELDIREWREDVWCYVTVQVTPVIGGPSQHLSAVEYGLATSGMTWSMDAICTDHVPDMVTELRATVIEFQQELAAMVAAWEE